MWKKRFVCFYIGKVFSCMYLLYQFKKKHPDLIAIFQGIGSRLLTKMGYVPGQGLGKAGEGRVQPVPIQLLPQGK